MKSEIKKIPNISSTKTCTNIFECGLSENLFNKNDNTIRNCLTCNHWYVIPKLDFKSHIDFNYDDSYFFNGKAGYPNYLNEKDIIIDHGIKYAGIVKKIKNPGKMLDVGCASGFLLKGFTNQGWSGKGIDPNDQMVLYGRKELGLDVEKSTLEEYETDDKYDLITLIQVIGHFYNLDKSIAKLSRILAKDGIILIECWDRESFIARILGRHWHEYSPPSVLHWFSKKTLKNIFLQYGFIPVISGRPNKKISLIHAFSLVEEKTTLSFIKKLLRRIGNSNLGKRNLIYPPLDLFWIIFKKVEGLS